MLGLLTSDFGYQNRLTLLQQLIDCGDVLLGNQLILGLDNRISNSRSSVSPDVAPIKEVGLSESDDEVAAATHRIGPPLSPIGSGSPSSASSSQSDSESESSSAESTAPAPVPSAAAAAPSAPAPSAAAPAQRSSWSLSNFAPPPAQPPDQPFDSGKELRNVLAVVKGKPSPISELSDSDTSCPSPGSVRRRAHANRTSTASSDDDTDQRSHHTSPARVAVLPRGAQKRGRPPLARAEERPAKKKRGRPKKPRPPEPRAADSEPEPPPPPAPLHSLQDKTHIFRKVFTPKKGDEGGGKGGKGGKGKGGKGKGQVTIIEVERPEAGADEAARRHRHEEALARVSPPPAPRRRDQRRASIERAEHRRSDDRHDRPRDSTRVPRDRTSSDRSSLTDRSSNGDRLSSSSSSDKPTRDKTPQRAFSERLSGSLSSERRSAERVDKSADKLHDRLDKPPSRPDVKPDVKPNDRLDSKMSIERAPDKMIESKAPADSKMSIDRLTDGKLSIDRLTDGKMALRLESKCALDPLERLDSKMPLVDRFVRAEADVGSGLKPGRGSERLEEATSIVSERRKCQVMVRIPLARLRADTLRALQRPRRPPPAKRTPLPSEQLGSVAATNHERTGAAGQTPIYYSYFERLPADALSDEERDHKYYLEEATRLRTSAEREQEPLTRVMLYLESVLCFVLTGRVLELELDTKGAFTVYRETIEYIKLIHSMPQRFRASPHDTFNKLDILGLRVQALLYLRMFKMYNREVKEYNKIVTEYQQKPACAESASPLSPTPSPAGSVGSVGSAASASSGYCSLVHSVPAHAHQALLLLTKYYAFLYVAHDLWERADGLCRLKANQDLFISVDRKCGPLSLSSTFRHLVQYVRYAISLLKSAPRE